MTADGDDSFHEQVRAAVRDEVDSAYHAPPFYGRYPYEEAAGAFLLASDEMGLGRDERLRAMADLFQRVTRPAGREGAPPYRDCWLALGYMAEECEPVGELLTDGQRERASSVVSLGPRMHERSE